MTKVKTCSLQDRTIQVTTTFSPLYVCPQTTKIQFIYLLGILVVCDVPYYLGYTAMALFPMHDHLVALYTMALYQLYGHRFHNKVIRWSYNGKNRCFQVVLDCTL